MKKLITVLFSSACAVVVFGAWIQSDNGKAGYNNSPGEGNCTSCHASYPLNSGGGTVYVTSNLTNGKYTPGQTYTMNVVVKRMGMGLFAFGAEILTGVNNAGTLIITNGVKTQLKTKTVSGVVRNNVVHQLDGGLAPDSAVFSFDWTAPATNIGDVKVYFTGMACDADQSFDGDYVYVDSLLIPYNSPSSINELAGDFSLSVYPNPVTDVVNMNYHLEKSSIVKAQLVSVDGKLAQTLFNEKQQAGDISKSIKLQNGIAKGNYLIEVYSDNGKVVKKIVVR